MRRLTLALLAAAALVTPRTSGAAPYYSRMIVFGDSYEDVGNFHLDPPYYMSRASNGPVWVEDLATDLHLPVPVRSSAGGANATDFAFSGAAATGSYVQSAPDLSSQVGSYLVRGRPTGTELVVIKIGGADLLFGPGNPSVAANAVKTQIARLAGQGVKSFLVANLPRLGALPAYHGTADEVRLTGLGAQFNADLDANLATLRSTLGPGVDLRAFDMHDLFEDALAHPQTYNLTNVTQSALDVGARDPNHYLWWDVRHPTAAFHQVMAAKAALIVPEPGAASLLGLSVLTLLRRRRRPTARTPGACHAAHPLERRILLSTFTVDTTSDITDPADGRTTLREALVMADANPGADTITFDGPRLTSEGPATIELGSKLVVSSDVTVIGYTDPATGNAGIAISGGNRDAVFDMEGGTVAITGLTITKGSGSLSMGGAVRVAQSATVTLSNCTVSDSRDYYISTWVGFIGNGGGITNLGTLNILGGEITGNASASGGGGIYNSGTLTVSGSNIWGNSARAGGGIFNRGSLTLSGNVTGNQASSGGGICNTGLLTLSAAGIDENRSDFGGGIFNGQDGSLTAAGFTEISRNVAIWDGGGMCSHGTATLTNTGVSDNSCPGDGGGIFSDGTLTLVNGCTVSGNSSQGQGGGIRNEGTLSATQIRIDSNSASEGGGVENEGPMSLIDSTVVQNVATNDPWQGASGSGGGIRNYSALTVISSAFVGNSAFPGDGGGISNAGTLNLTNSTLTGNLGFDGGGISNSGAITVVNCTVSGNRAATGGGFSGLGRTTPATIRNSIIAGNFRGNYSVPDDIFGTVDAVQSRHNLIGTGGSGGLQSGVNGNTVDVGDPRLAPIGVNGGRTMTMALLPGSPAIDAGDNALAVGPDGTPLAGDQRGFAYPRIANGTVDIGAFEAQSAAVVVATHAFYHDSSFDRNTATADAVDDQAIATDKAALLPGQAATFANVTSFDKGLNGVMIDMAGMPVTHTLLSAADFDFGGAGAPMSVTVWPGAGAGGSDRITLIWRDYNPEGASALRAVANGWLTLTVKANAHTGLAAPDVFSFGNLIAETGDAGGTLGWRVNAIDLAAVKHDLNTPTTITSRSDINRDGRVNALDVALVKRNLSHSLPVPIPIANTTTATAAPPRRVAEDVLA